LRIFMGFPMDYDGCLSCIGLRFLVAPQDPRFAMASCVMGVIVFCMNIAILYWPAFQSETRGCAMSASIMTLTTCDNTTAVTDFCASDEGVCHHSECEGIEYEFCDITTSVKVMVALSLCFLLCSILYLASILSKAYGIWSNCPLCCRMQNSWSVARASSWLQMLAAILNVIIVPLWAGARGEHPDYNVSGQWEYLPSHLGLHWSAKGGYFFLATMMAVFSIISAVFGIVGAASLREGAPPTMGDGQEQLVPVVASLPAAQSSQSEMTSDYAQFSDSTL